MDTTLRLFVIILSLLVFFSVIYMLVKRNLNESNSVLWLFIALFTLFSGIFPGVINSVAAFVGIDYPPSLLFLVSILVLMLLMFKSSMHSSKTEAKLNEISITLSILKDENKRLVETIEKMQSGKEHDTL